MLPFRQQEEGLYGFSVLSVLPCQKEPSPVLPDPDALQGASVRDAAYFYNIIHQPLIILILSLRLFPGQDPPGMTSAPDRDAVQLLPYGGAFMKIQEGEQHLEILSNGVNRDLSVRIDPEKGFRAKHIASAAYEGPPFQNVPEQFLLLRIARFFIRRPSFLCFRIKIPGQGTDAAVFRMFFQEIDPDLDGIRCQDVIAVGPDQILPGYEGKAVPEGGGCIPVPRPQDPEGDPFFFQPALPGFRDGRAPVLRPVVHQDQLQLPIGLPQDGLQISRKIFRCVVHRRHDGDQSLRKNFFAQSRFLLPGCR